MHHSGELSRPSATPRAARRSVAAAILVAAAAAPAAGQGITVRVGEVDSARTEAEQARADTLAFRRDSAQTARDSAEAARLRARVTAVTPRLLATAFRDARARDLLTRARAARAAQDSSLAGYDATTYERTSVGFESARAPAERLLFRAERATRVRWRRGVGAVIDVTGQRSGSPVLNDGSAEVALGNAPPVPYVPGQEALWAGSGLAQTDVGNGALVNPLANGAEAYYTYAAGDTFALRLGGRRALVVRELRVRPRVPSWSVVVGSLWIDDATGRLVRAVYRLSAPNTVKPTVGDDNGREARGLGGLLARALTPTVTVQLDVVTVDYGLFEDRFWLPRAQTIDGSAAVAGVRAPVHVRQRFDYRAVNEAVELPPVRLGVADTARTLSAYLERAAAGRHECADTAAVRVRNAARYHGRLAVVTRVPCDTAALARSPSLPPSLYSAVDTLFDESERAALAGDALGLGDGAGFSPGRPTFRSGLGLARYNRVEGLSMGIEAWQGYGAGLDARALLRSGFADESVSGELALVRSNGRDSVALGAYQRLAAANDWGDPFSLGASLKALVGGVDDGVYYRAAGAEVVLARAGRLVDSWRLFTEHEWDAVPRARFSVRHALDADHVFGPNIDAESGRVTGLALRSYGAAGEDPSRTRLLSDLRLEAAAGSFDYVRAMLDVTLDRPLTRGLGVTLTAGGGTSGGHLPAQRLWYLGGPYTVRGQPVGAAAGSAYWLSRLELGSRSAAAKPVVFADLGWAGDRGLWREDVRPVSGAGVGMSLLDGLLRFDVAKGIRPARGVQVNTYFGARF